MTTRACAVSAALPCCWPRARWRCRRSSSRRRRRCRPRRRHCRPGRSRRRWRRRASGPAVPAWPATDAPAEPAAEVPALPAVAPRRRTFRPRCPRRCLPRRRLFRRCPRLPALARSPSRRRHRRHHRRTPRATNATPTTQTRVRGKIAMGPISSTDRLRVVRRRARGPSPRGRWRGGCAASPDRARAGARAGRRGSGSRSCSSRRRPP